MVVDAQIILGTNYNRRRKPSGHSGKTHCGVDGGSVRGKLRSDAAGANRNREWGSPGQPERQVSSSSCPFAEIRFTIH
jgi:hypothetical protein